MYQTSYERLAEDAAKVRLNTLQTLELHVLVVLLYLWKLLFYRRPQMVERDDISPEMYFEVPHELRWLSPEQLEAFRRDGFVGPFDHPDLDAVDALRGELDGEFFTPGRDFYDFMHVDAQQKARMIEEKDPSLAMNSHLTSSASARLLQSPEVVARLGDVCASRELGLWSSQYFRQYPGEEGTFIHQNVDFKDLKGGLVRTSSKLYPNSTLNVWLALADCTRESGALYVVKGSQYRLDLYNLQNNYLSGSLSKKLNLLCGYETRHLRDVLKVVRFALSGHRGRSRLLELYNNEVLGRRVEPTDLHFFECKRGQYYIFSSMLAHGSMTNETEHTRHTLVGRFFAAGVAEIADKRETVISLGEAA